MILTEEKKTGPKVTSNWEVNFNVVKENSSGKFFTNQLQAIGASKFEIIGITTIRIVAG